MLVTKLQEMKYDVIGHNDTGTIPEGTSTAVINYRDGQAQEAYFLGRSVGSMREQTGFVNDPQELQELIDELNSKHKKNYVDNPEELEELIKLSNR